MKELAVAVFVACIFFSGAPPVALAVVVAIIALAWAGAER